ncbi:MAG TPA: dihydrofolate reductase family protein [Polyangia bacterium]|nr:dihydrofolate reductase family protein [Polyangia bacterium]
MSRLRMQLSISLDGFVAGPNQTAEDPIGKNGLRLHDWVFGLKAWRRQHGMEGGEDNASTVCVEEATANVGAVLMGRNMFGPVRGSWEASAPWDGWWGETPPYHCPVFVLTHHARAPLVMKGGTTFHFVTGGPEAALAEARRVAGEKDVSIAGGASLARQVLAAGVVDEVELHLAPLLLGSGERLFDGGMTDLHGLTLVRTIAAPGVTHLKFSR